MRRALRGLVIVTAAAAVGLTTGAASAAADPWLSWTVISGANVNGVLGSTVYTADATVGTRSTLAAKRRAIAVDTSDDGLVTAYTTQTTSPRSGRPRNGLTVVVDGVARTLSTTRVSGTPDTAADGTSVTYARQDGTVLRYEIATGQLTTLCRECRGLPARYNPRPAAVALSPDGQHVAVRWWSDGDPEALAVYRTSDGTRVARRTMGEGEPDTAMAWTQDSRQLAFVSLASLGAPDFTSAWRIVLLGVDNTLTDTAVQSDVRRRLSGPMRIADTWYLTQSPDGSPTAQRVTVLSTPSLSVAPQAIGTVTTRRASRDLPYVGTWSMSAARPAPLP